MRPTNESLARKIYFELLRRENLEVIDGPRTDTLVHKAYQLAAAFGEGPQDLAEERQTSKKAQAYQPQPGLRREEGYRRRFRDREREVLAANDAPARQRAMPELKLAEESQASRPSRSGLQEIQPLE